MTAALIIIAVLVAISCIISEAFLRFALSPGVKNTKEEEDPVFMSQENQEERRRAAAFLESECCELEIVAQDGAMLRAHLFTNPSCHDWLVTVHGYKADRLCNGTLYIHEAQRGVNCLIVDVRGHGESTGRWLSMGLWESGDIELWCRHILTLDKDARIFLHGVSMGGATVMMAAGRNIPHVVGVIEDCGYSSLYDEFSCQLKAMFHLPTHPILDLVSLWCRLRLGFSFHDVEPAKELKKTKIPMLFIHGDKDSFVPTRMVRQCVEAHNGPHEVWLPKDVSHAASLILCKEEYLDRVDAFMASCLHS